MLDFLVQRDSLAVQLSVFTRLACAQGAALLLRHPRRVDHIWCLCVQNLNRVTGKLERGHMIRVSGHVVCLVAGRGRGLAVRHVGDVRISPIGEKRVALVVPVFTKHCALASLSLPGFSLASPGAQREA